MTGGVVLHRVLWESNRDLALACLGHPFVRGLADGSLPADVFKRYVAQDAFFLRSFLRAYCVAAARCTARPRQVGVFHGLIGGALEELELHARYAKSLGIDLERVRPNAETSAYTDFLERTAWTCGAGEVVSAMTPCMRLYAFLGQSLGPAVADNPYREWIATYSSDEFEALAAGLETLLDEIGEDTSAIRSAYRYAMNCELDFFAAV
jgi:thiaminase/transcriptional activator TenA